MTGKELKEATHINSGLLALGNVISALANEADAQGKGKKAIHIPYRSGRGGRLCGEVCGGEGRAGPGQEDDTHPLQVRPGREAVCVCMGGKGTGRARGAAAWVGRCVWAGELKQFHNVGIGEGGPPTNPCM